MTFRRIRKSEVGETPTLQEKPLFAPRPLAGQLSQTESAPAPIQRSGSGFNFGNVAVRSPQPAIQPQVKLPNQVATPAPAPTQLQRESQSPAPSEAPPDLESGIQQARMGGQPISDPVRAPLEQAFGADFSQVKVHTDTQADHLNRSIQAKAFTTGNDIFFQQGSYSPNTPSGQELLAHELTHTIQQGATTQQPADQASPSIARKTDPTQSAPIRTRSSFPTIQRRSATKVAQDKTKLLAIREQVLLRLIDKRWPEAIHGFHKQNLQYHASGLWGRTDLGKWSRGINTLEPQRKRAKNLVSQRDTKEPTEVLDQVKDIADKTRTASKPDNFGDSDLQHAVGMTEKIAHYLIESIPTPIKTFSAQFSTGAMDLTSVLAPHAKPGAAGGGAKSPKVANDEGDIQNALTTGAMDTRGFHGSASWLLEGLDKSGGKLLSQKAAFDAGLLKTGEGTTFSSGAGLKTNVYIGKGETGFGTAASYALAPGELTSYNVSLYSDADLAQTIQDYQKIIQLEAKMKLMDPTLVGSGKQVVVERLLEAAKQAGIDPDVDKSYARIRELQNMVQLKDLLGKLLKEQEARTQWDKDDPRRAGGQMNPDNYPILLEFDTTGLTVSEDVGGKQREEKGDYRLAGEATVANEIDLGAGRLKVVYCPEQFIGKTKAKLDKVFGTPNTIEIRALEAVKGGIASGSKADKTIKATYGQLEKQQKALDVKIKAQKDLADNLTTPGSFVGKGGVKFEQRTDKASGTTGYVSTDATKSLSDNPAFEAKALTFEKRLGAYAFRHAKANAAAGAMSTKIVKYLDERKKLVEKLKQKQQEKFKGAEAYGRIGDVSKRIAGAVGNNIDDIKAVFAGGNLRERMTHIYNFSTRVLHEDMELAKVDALKAKVQKILRAADLDEGEAGAVKEMPKDEVMDQRDSTRFKSGQNTSGDYTAKGLEDAGLGLSDREKQHLGADQDTSKVNWNEGAKMWLLNESNTWVQAQREVGIPLMAGPSSHTNALMRTAKALKLTNLADVRLAIIGHLVPIRAHSLVEILAAAKPHGVPYKQGQEMYTDIQPLDRAELQTHVCESGKFPHEP